MTQTNQTLHLCGHDIIGPNRPCVLLKGHQGGEWDHVEQREIMTSAASLLQTYPGLDADEIESAQLAARRRDTNERWAKIVPARFAHATIDDIDATDAVQNAVHIWLNKGKPSGNLLIFGNVGTGKSHLAYSCARYVFEDTCRRPVPVAAVSVTDWLAHRRPGSEPTANDERVTVADLAILDDLGAEKSSEWVDQELFTLIDGRWRNGLPTIATTNLDLDQLQDAIGARCWDRLRDDALVIRLTGKSRRQPREVAA